MNRYGPCAPVCVYTRNSKTADVNKTEQLAGGEGEKRERLVHMCVRPPAGHCHVISHVEGYPSVKIQEWYMHPKISTHTFAQTQTHTSPSSFDLSGFVRWILVLIK